MTMNQFGHIKRKKKDKEKPIKPTPMTANVYKSFMFPFVRRIPPNLISTDLVSIQPDSEDDIKQLVEKNKWRT